MRTPRYYRSQVFSPDEELSAEAARSSERCVIVHYAADQPERAELQCNGVTFRVIYYGRSWPDDELYRQHQARYGRLPMDVVAAATDMGRGLSRRTFNIDEQGVIQGSELELLDERGEPSSRLRHAPDGTLLSEEIYEYRANGELSAVYERMPDGTLMRVYEVGSDAFG